MMTESRTLKSSPDGEVLPPSSQTDLTSFRGKWPALLECASPAFDVQRFAELTRSADWSRLLVLVEEHTVLGHLAMRLRELDQNLVTLPERKP